MQPVWMQIQFLFTQQARTQQWNLKKQQKNCSIELPRQVPLPGKGRLWAEIVLQPRQAKSSRTFRGEKHHKHQSFQR